MAGSDSRRALTIRRAREGTTLLRTVERAEPPRPTFDSPQRFPLLPAIEAIARTLDQGAADEVARVLSGDGAASAGEALFQTLFGAESDFIALLRDLTGDPSADAHKHPLRIRVVTADALFAGLPFQLTARAGERLEAWLTSRRHGLRAASPGFDVALLPPARALDRDEMRSCLAEAWPEPCPAPLLDHAADAVLARAHGELDATLALVADAHATSWAALLRALDKTEPPTTDDEIF